MSAHLRQLRQSSGLLQGRKQGAKARDVVWVCLEGASVGVDRSFHVTIGGQRIRQAPAVRRLLLAVEQDVEALQGLA